MRFSFTTATAYLAYALAAPVAAPEAQSSPDGFLAIPMSHAPPLEGSKIPTFASDAISIEMVNEVMAYFVDIELGGQKCKVLVDTGSSFLWVWNSHSATCNSTTYHDQCVSDGAYNPSNSSTSVDLQSGFHIQYGKGYANGEFYSDTAKLGAAKVDKLKFGVSPGYVNDGGFATVFGIGVSHDNDSSFSTQLLNDGVIKRQVYGMSLGEPGDQSSSEITFGALNTGRFEGDLEKLPYSGNHFVVKGSAKIGDKEFISNGDVILDSGTSLTFLQTDNYKAYMDVVNSTGITLYPQPGGINIFLCEEASKIPDSTFKFGNKEIKISARDLSINAHTIDSRNSENLCIFGVVMGDGSMNLFGDTFMRNIYSVYDLERSEVHIAQTKRGQPNNYTVVTGDVPAN